MMDKRTARHKHIELFAEAIASYREGPSLAPHYLRKRAERSVKVVVRKRYRNFLLPSSLSPFKFGTLSLTLSP